MHFDDPSCAPFTRWAAARTQRFVAVSEYVRRTLAVKAPPFASRTTTICNGVDTAHFAPGEARDGFSLCIVCRLVSWKRVDLAIGGGVRLKPVKRIVRCAATNVDPSTGARDLTIPATLMQAFGHADCGIYGEVIAEGDVAIGDKAVVLPN